ncbi:MAG: pentapeptide repeat-containing protein [Bacteroides sp.]
MMKLSKEKKRMPVRVATPLMEQPQTDSLQSLKELLEKEETLADLHFAKGTEEYINRPYRSLKNCTFTGKIFLECQLKSAQLSDVRFENCDLSNVSFADSSLHRVEFDSCKLVGTNLSETTLNHVSMTHCSGMYINLSMSKMTQVSFRDCDFRNGSLNDSRLSLVEFPGCMLLETDFSHTSLRGIDLRSSRISGIQLTIADLRGAIISSLQAMDLLPLLGVVIEDC